MKATVDAKAFSRALNKVCKGLEKSRIPILEEVRAVFDGARCVLTATNLVQWVTAEISAQGDAFSFVFRRSKDVAKICGYFEGELSMELAGEKKELCLTMSCGHRAGELDVTPGEDFPTMPEFAAEETYPMDAAALLARVNRVKYAAACKGDFRPEFGGVRFQDCRVACLDGCRLAVDTDRTLTVQTPLIVPKKALELLKLFDGGQITMSWNKKQICFSGDGLTVLSRLLEDGEFQLDACVPKQFKEEFALRPKEFLRELDFLDRSAPPKCKPNVRFDRGSLSLCSAGTRHAARVEIGGDSAIVFDFNLNHMADVLKQFAGKEWVTLHVASSYAPIVISAVGRSDMAMVAPLRLRESAAA